MCIRAFVFDRDGTLISHVPYLCKPKDVVLKTDARNALQCAIKSGCNLFLHTNQSGIGRGLFSLDDVHICNDRMIALLELGHSPFSRICIAPETPEVHSKYRKPSPSFANEIMQEYGLLADQICYIGDRACDLQTALAAGTRGIGLTTGLNDIEAELAVAGLTGRFPICHDLISAVELALGDTWPL